MNSLDNISLDSNQKSHNTSKFHSVISHEDYKSFDNMTVSSSNIRNTQSFNN